MDVNSLFTDQGMRQTTSVWRDQHMEDARQYGQIKEIVRRRLKQTPIDGDRWFDVKIRAWRVSRQVKAMERHSRRAAACAEATYATFAHQVVNLPERRAVRAGQKAARKQQRAVNTGAFVAKSLDKSARSLSGQAVTSQVSGSQDEGQFLDAEPFPFPMAAGDEGRSHGSIGDFFPTDRR